MSSSQKALKVISIILIVFAAITILGGVLTIAGMGLLGAAGGAVGDSPELGVVIGAAGALLGVVILLTGGVDLLIAILGLRGANNPSKIGPFFVLSIIGAAFSLLGIIFNLVSNNFQFTSLIGFALLLACVLLARNIKKEATLS